MRADYWTLLAALAATQYGLVSTSQLLAIGIPEQALHRAVSAGLLHKVRHGVYGVNGAPPSRWQPLMAACLGAGEGAVASHRAAAGLHGLPGIAPGQLDLLARAFPAELDDVRCHRTTALPKAQCTSVANIPCTTPERTIVDLAASVHPTLLARIVDHADRHGLCGGGDIARCLSQIGSRGRHGARALREVLDSRVGGDSPLEADWLRLL